MCEKQFSPTVLLLACAAFVVAGCNSRRSGIEKGKPWLKPSFDSAQRTGRKRFARRTSTAPCPSMHPTLFHSISIRPAIRRGGQ